MRHAKLVSEIDNAIAAHKAWKQRLRSSIADGCCDISSAVARCDHYCAFGQWLYGNTMDPRTRASVSYREVKQLHPEFHRLAGTVLAYVERGHASAARFIMDGEYAALSEMLIDALIDWRDVHEDKHRMNRPTLAALRAGTCHAAFGKAEEKTPELLPL